MAELHVVDLVGVHVGRVEFLARAQIPLGDLAVLVPRHDFLVQSGPQAVQRLIAVWRQRHLRCFRLYLAGSKMTFKK